jgi:hypothetical protein
MGYDPNRFLDLGNPLGFGTLRIGLAFGPIYILTFLSFTFNFLMNFLMTWGF